MTSAYDPRRVAMSALALACFSVGFTVTAAAYLGANAPRTAAAHDTDAAPLVNATERAATASVTRDPARGCRLGG